MATVPSIEDEARRHGEWINLFLQAFFGTFGFTLLMLNGVARTSAGASVLVINVAQSGDADPGSLSGNLMVLGAECCESFYVILSRRLTQTLPAIDICAYTHGIGLVLMLPLGASSLIGFDWSSVAAGTWALVLWYGLSASIFSF